MDLQLTNKIILITGAAGLRGSIGYTLAFMLAEEGATILLLDKSERGIGYEKDLQGKSPKSKFYQTDLSKPEEIKTTIQKIEREFAAIDVVINNVGINDGVGLNSSIEDFMRSLQLNLISYYATVKYALPLLKKNKGNILNIGSKVAITGQGGTSGYAAAKGGVLALTREWATDLIKHKIRCNALIISESMTPAYKNWLSTFENGVEK